MQGSFFQCPRIFSIFSKLWFLDLRRCLHLTNEKLHEHVDRGGPRFDKLHQTRWFLNAIQDRYKAIWNLGKHVTIDKMMFVIKAHIAQLANICQTNQRSGASRFGAWCALL